MKKILLIIVLFVSNFVYADNIKDTISITTQDYNNLILDSLSFFSLVDSLKKDEHTEFAVSEMLTYINSDYDYDLIFKTLLINEIPWDYVETYKNDSYYPLTEYINDGSDKKYKNMRFYITYDEGTFGYIIYWLRPV